MDFQSDTRVTNCWPDIGLLLVLVFYHDVIRLSLTFYTLLTIKIVTIFSSAGSTRGLDVTGLNKLVVASVTSIVEVSNGRFAYSPNSRSTNSNCW